MASTLDHSVGIAAESTYGTSVTPTRWIQWMPDSSLMWDPQFIQGGGLRVGTFVDRSARRRNGYGRGEITIRAELTSKTFGLLLRSALGTGTSTLVSGSTYQQLFTAGQTGSSLPSLTIQAGIVDSAGTVRPHTFAGCVCMSWSLDTPEDGGPTIFEATYDARTLDTATSLTTPVMPADTASDFRARDVSAVTVGGTLTVPSTTVLASGGTAATYFRNLRIECDNALDVDRTVMGARQQPTVGKRDIKLSATAEFSDTVLRDAFINQTATAISATFTSSESLSTGVAQYQIAVPVVKINSGPVPTPTDGTSVTFDFEGQVLDDGVATSALYVALRTADTAL